jgi:hypothetical protein
LSLSIHLSISIYEGLKCGTAPGTLFDDRAELMAHYKTDWHRENLSRREKDLPLLTKEEFEEWQQQGGAATIVLFRCCADLFFSGFHIPAFLLVVPVSYTMRKSTVNVRTHMAHSYLCTSTC